MSITTMLQSVPVITVFTKCVKELQRDFGCIQDKYALNFIQDNFCSIFLFIKQPVLVIINQYIFTCMEVSQTLYKAMFI